MFYIDIDQKSYHNTIIYCFIGQAYDDMSLSLPFEPEH